MLFSRTLLSTSQNLRKITNNDYKNILYINDTDKKVTRKRFFNSVQQYTHLYTTHIKRILKNSALNKCIIDNGNQSVGNNSGLG